MSDRLNSLQRAILHYAALHGKIPAGTNYNTVMALARRHYIDMDNRITDAGRAALAAQEK